MRSLRLWSFVADSTAGGDCANSGTINNDTDTLIEDGNYGGTTATMALLPGSLAIDAGDSANCPALDQRSAARMMRR